MRLAAPRRETVELSFVIAVSAVLSALLLWGWRERRRAFRAERSERLARERRDRFLAEAASELKAPLDTLRSEILALGARPTPDRTQALVQSLDELRALVDELARLPPQPSVAQREEIDLAELVREVVEAPPFSDRGPSVIVRAAPARVVAERARLLNGLRILLWVARRGVHELVVTVSSDDERALVEVSGHGAHAAVEALERESAVAYGAAPATAPAGTTLALRVAAQVARAHGGRLRGSTRIGRADRLVLELPTFTAA
jgi:hypothetical protein